MQHAGATQYIPFHRLPANTSEKIKVLLITNNKKAPNSLLKRPTSHSLLKQTIANFEEKNDHFFATSTL